MNHRVQRVKTLIKRELGTILERDFSFSGSFVTIQDVDVTPDFKQCFVYLGVMGNGVSPATIIQKLTNSRHLIQKDLFKRVILRNSPTLTFRHDTSVERGVRIVQLIDNLPEPLPDLAPEAAAAAQPLSNGDDDSGVEDEEGAALGEPARAPRKAVAPRRKGDRR